MNINVLHVAAWDGLDKTMIINLFKTCPLTVAVDGSEDGHIHCLGCTSAFGVYIRHKICHCMLATSATLLSHPDITMSEGPKDQTS